MDINNKARIHWACRRGMRELDISIMPFFEYEYDTLSDEDKQLFIRLLYEDWDERKYRFHLLEKDDEKNAQKGNREWFHDLELYCAAYEQREISHEEVYLENTKTLLVGHVLINTYLREHPGFPQKAKKTCRRSNAAPKIGFSKKKSTVLPAKYSAFLVENSGIEPLTSCMPCKRSPS